MLVPMDLSVAHDGHCPKSHLHGWRAGRGAAHFASWVGMPGECLLQEEPLSKSVQFFDPTKAVCFDPSRLKKKYLCWAEQRCPKVCLVATFCDLVFSFSSLRCRVLFVFFFHIKNRTIAHQLTRINRIQNRCNFPHSSSAKKTHKFYTQKNHQQPKTHLPMKTSNNCKPHQPLFPSFVSA